MGLIVAENKSLEQVRGKGSHTSLENFLTQRRKGRKVSGAKTQRKKVNEYLFIHGVVSLFISSCKKFIF
jgi:hypothetical protein